MKNTQRKDNFKAGFGLIFLGAGSMVGLATLSLILIITGQPLVVSGVAMAGVACSGLVLMRGCEIVPGDSR